ncbi:tetratricopeptide repeat protein, partial [Treponema sp. R6D11]
AITIYRRILPSAGRYSASVANNLGNVYFQKGNIDTAEQYYNQAIGFDSGYPNAYLGRANTRIKAGNLQNAVSDYEQYLRLEPRSSQRVNIEQLINLIRTEAATAEMKKMLAEEEARRLAEEKQKLLDSVSASLQSGASSGKGL